MDGSLLRWLMLPGCLPSFEIVRTVAFPIAVLISATRRSGRSFLKLDCCP